jgi:type 1 glutamine amidotransferase
MQFISSIFARQTTALVRLTVSLAKSIPHMRNRSLYAAPLSLFALTVASCGANDDSLDKLNDILAMPSAAPTMVAPPASTTAAPPPSMMVVTPTATAAAPPSTMSTATEPPAPSASVPGTVPSQAEPTVTATSDATMAVPSMDVPPMPSATEMPAASATEMPPPVEMGPYAPRTGSFKMLIYSITKAFKHDSIPQGVQMLKDIGVEQGFETVVAADNSDITLEGLSKYEIVFFMNSTGDIFNPTEQQAYEDWMTTKNGAFGGTHSATDTENGWEFYSEVTGQYYDLHDNCCAAAQLQWQPAALEHVAVKGLPSPWNRSDEWYKFNRAGQWSTKAGFTILSTVTTDGGGTRPVSFVREYGNFRSFYTSLGHQGSAFQDADVKKHIARGIMWAVRREAEIVGL